MYTYMYVDLQFVFFTDTACTHEYKKKANQITFSSPASLDYEQSQQGKIYFFLLSGS